MADADDADDGGGSGGDESTAASADDGDQPPTEVRPYQLIGMAAGGLRIGVTAAAGDVSCMSGLNAEPLRPAVPGGDREASLATAIMAGGYATAAAAGYALSATNIGLPLPP